MFYVKNVPVLERGIRFLVGIGMLYVGLFVLKGSWIGYLAAGAGLVPIVTGFAGFCPMCAMVGRKPVGKGS
jgi:Protein of unknown function (DUF2892)